jgi:Uma2 family endonuclease
MTRLAATIPDNPPALLDGIPIIYEDDVKEELDVGEGSYHYSVAGVVFWALVTHLRRYHPDLRPFANLNCYYLDKPKSRKSGRSPYVCPDVMVVKLADPSRQVLDSYRLGKDGTAPYLAIEVLSHWSGLIRDPVEKPEIYARLGIQEYVLVDELGKFQLQPLLLKRLREDRTYEEVIDEDGGVTSQLGFRIVHDGKAHVIDTNTGRRYLHPDEAELRSQELESENRALREELERLKGKKPRKRKKDANGEDS